MPRSSSPPRRCAPPPAHWQRWAVAVALLIACAPGEVATTAATTATTTDEATTSPTTAGDTTQDPTTDVTSSSTTDETTDTTSTPTTDSTDPTSDTTTEPLPPIECITAPGDHAADCPEPCPLTLDVEIRCYDDRFAGPGLRVAPTPGPNTYVVTSSKNSWFLFAAHDDEADAIPDLPGNFVGESILLATDPAGRVHLAADEFKPMGTKTGAAFVHQLDGAWKREVIAVNGGLSTPVVDLEFDQDGTVYAWIDNTPDDGFSLVTRATDGTWTPTAVESIGDNWQRFTLDANSVPVALGYTGVFGPWKLRALTGGVATFLGDTTSTSTPHLYPTTRSPVFGLDVTTPPYAVGLQDHEALAVVWPSGDAYTQVELPGTALYANLCSLPPYPDCDPGPCHETSIGVYNSEFALARTQDGALWLAAMLTHIDEVYTYAEKCYQGDCECVSKLGSDDTYGQLALFRVDPEAPTPTTVLTLTTPVIDHRAASSGSYHIGRTIDMRAHGSELAIGLRLYGPYVRLLRLDTAQL